MCDFKSQWASGVKIHMARKHSKIDQLDGNVSVSYADDNDDKYHSIRHYLKKGWLGSAYQTFIDAMEVIEESDLNEEEKIIEKDNVLEARKLALGQNYKYFPPWDSSPH